MEIRLGLVCGHALWVGRSGVGKINIGGTNRWGTNRWGTSNGGPRERDHLRLYKRDQRRTYLTKSNRRWPRPRPWADWGLSIYLEQVVVDNVLI